MGIVKTNPRIENASIQSMDQLATFEI